MTNSSHFKIVYNVNGKEEALKLEELESSTLFSNGAPKSIAIAMDFFTSNFVYATFDAKVNNR